MTNLNAVKLPPSCKECGLEAIQGGQGRVKCDCMRCTLIRASGFCNSNHETSYWEEKDKTLEMERKKSA